MTPDHIAIYLMSALGALLLGGGALLVGRATVQRADDRNRAVLQAQLATARAKLNQAQDQRAEPPPSSRSSGSTKSEAQAVENSSDAVSAELEQLRFDLQQANSRIEQMSKDQTALIELRAKFEAIKKDREQLLATSGAAPGTSAESQKAADVGMSETEEKLRDELRVQEQRIEALTASLSKETAELERVKGEAQSAKDRLAVVDRLMQGVRARSAQLTEELREKEAELKALKKDGT